MAKYAAPTRRRRWWFVRDPAGIIIASFAWVAIVVALASVYMAIQQSAGLWSVLGVLQAVWFTGLFGMCFWCHFTVLTTNPGTVPAKLRGIAPEQAGGGASGGDGSGDDDDEYEEVEEEMPLNEFECEEDDGSLLIFCDECNIYRPSRAMHCHTCERCVVLQDHHCPWVNNCVGIGNHKPFLLLLVYVGVTSFHVAAFVLLQYITCSHGARACGFQPEQLPGRLGLWLLAAACVFGLFCSAMFAMELYCIYLDPIFSVVADQMAARGGSKSKSRLERHLSVICATDGFRASWLLPPAAPRSLHDIELVQGFRCHPDDLEIC